MGVHLEMIPFEEATDAEWNLNNMLTGTGFALVKPTEPLEAAQAPEVRIAPEDEDSVYVSGIKADLRAPGSSNSTEFAEGENGVWLAQRQYAGSDDLNGYIDPPPLTAAPLYALHVTASEGGRRSEEPGIELHPHLGAFPDPLAFQELGTSTQEAWYPILSGSGQEEGPTALKVEGESYNVSLELMPLSQASVTDWDATGTLEGTGTTIVKLTGPLDAKDLTLHTHEAGLWLISSTEGTMTNFKELAASWKKDHGELPANIDALYLNDETDYSYNMGPSRSAGTSLTWRIEGS